MLSNLNMFEVQENPWITASLQIKDSFHHQDRARLSEAMKTFNELLVMVFTSVDINLQEIEFGHLISTIIDTDYEILNLVYLQNVMASFFSNEHKNSDVMQYFIYGLELSRHHLQDQPKVRRIAIEIADEFRIFHKIISPISDLSFLGESYQSVYGKPSQSRCTFFPNQFLSMMDVHFWHEDWSEVPYFEAAEKKHFKLKRQMNGKLARAIDYETGILDGDYLYVVSPKGGMYVAHESEDDKEIFKSIAIDLKNIRHSTFRSGQPVVSAGELKIQQGEIVEINHSSGHYRPPYENFLACILYLHSKNMIAIQCILELQTNACGQIKVTVPQLLQDPSFEIIRENVNALSISGVIPEALSST